MSLEVKNLKVYYQTLRGQVKALDDMTFKINDGDILGLAGESGCGKSTFSNSLILLKPPMKYIGGEVLLDGEKLPIENYEEMKERRYKDISIIPQYALNAMNPTVKIGKYIRDVFTFKGFSFKEIEKELKRRLKIVGLDEKILDMYPIELSGGMKQRMVMVIATLMNPSLLIADEITSALDVSTQKAVSKMLVEFRDKKFVKSIIFVTHDVSVLYQIADKILIMYAGKFAEIGPAEEIIHNPKHVYTKLLVGAMPEVGIKYSETPLSGIPGHPPLLIDPPEGCRFRDRCPHSMEKCLKEPPMIEVGKDHYVACWKEVDRNA